MRIKTLSPFLFLLIALPITSNAATENTAKVTVTVNTFSDSLGYETYSQWISYKNGIAYDAKAIAEIENIDNCSQEKKTVACSLFSERTRHHLIRTSQAIPNEKAIKAYLEDLARRSNKDAIDAKFKIEGDRAIAFTADEPGIKLDIEKSIEAVKDFVEKNNSLSADSSLTLPFEIIKPVVTSGEINDLGIATLIGQGKSNFKGSPSNRIHNIKVATKRFDGILIKPGEEFSFVKILGDVDAEHGYLPELVIKKDKTEPEFGGGICQVSTTVFRAAIYSGLQITMRRNHAYPVGYYAPHGMDSTIYIPRPDLKFINNTPGHILVQPKFNGMELIMDFYGTNDGRKVEVDGPRIIESNPDKSIKTTFSQKVTDKDGKVIIDDIFNSSYQSPYKYPHTGDVMLSAKPSNWSEDEWEAYKDAYRAANPPAKKKR